MDEEEIKEIHELIKLMSLPTIYDCGSDMKWDHINIDTFDWRVKEFFERQNSTLVTKIGNNLEDLKNMDFNNFLKDIRRKIFSPGWKDLVLMKAVTYRLDYYWQANHLIPSTMGSSITNRIGLINEVLYESATRNFNKKEELDEFWKEYTLLNEGGISIYNNSGRIIKSLRRGYKDCHFAIAAIQEPTVYKGILLKNQEEERQIRIEEDNAAIKKFYGKIGDENLAKEMLRGLDMRYREKVENTMEQTEKAWKLCKVDLKYYVLNGIRHFDYHSMENNFRGFS